MINKLTKEQAAGLIAEIKEVAKIAPDDVESVHDYLIGRGTMIRHIEKIINQCIEKEFPELEMQVLDGDYVSIEADTGCGRDECKTSKEMVIWIDAGSQASLHLSKEQFKQFTAGCNKIVEYLE